jgi:hypothetical protein
VTPAEPWTLAFETPPFAYVRTTMRSRDDKGNRLVVDVALRAAVDPRNVADHVSFTIDGRPVDATYEHVSDAPNLVQFSLRSRLAQGKDAQLGITLEEGVRWLVDPSVSAAPAAETVTIGHGPAVAIRNVALVETAGGFHLDVACDDNAAPGAKRSFYDRSNWEWYENMSSRCVLADDSLAAHVRRLQPTSAGEPHALRVPSLRQALARPAPRRDRRGARPRSTEAWSRQRLTRDASTSLPGPRRSRSRRPAARRAPLGRTSGSATSTRRRSRWSCATCAGDLVFWMTGDEAADARSSEDRREHDPRARGRRGRGRDELSTSNRSSPIPRRVSTRSP